MEKKQTAVEWLHQMLKDSSKEVFDGNIWEQAKEMEKKQMLEFGSSVTERWGMCKVEPHFIKDQFDKIYKH